MKVLRLFAVLTVVLAGALPGGFAVAQQGPAKVPRIVLIYNLTGGITPDQFLGLSQGLADFGYVDATRVAGVAKRLSEFTDGVRVDEKNITLEMFISPTAAGVPALTAKAVATKPDILLVNGTPATQAAEEATASIPILSNTDLLGSGFVASLAHPGGNITGVSTVAPDLSGKKTAILKETVPKVTRLAVLNIPANAAIAREAGDAASAARDLGIEATMFDFSQDLDFAPQFERVIAANVNGVYVPQANYLYATNGGMLCELLLRHGLPSVSPVNLTCGLVAYGPNPTSQYRKFGGLIDAILRGSRPADLPVQQPTTFDFVLNLKAAKTLGLTIPPSILAQATQVIE